MIRGLVRAFTVNNSEVHAPHYCEEFKEQKLYEAWDHVCQEYPTRLSVSQPIEQSRFVGLHSTLQHHFRSINISLESGKTICPLDCYGLITTAVMPQDKTLVHMISMLPRPGPG